MTLPEPAKDFERSPLPRDVRNIELRQFSYENKPAEALERDTLLELDTGKRFTFNRGQWKHIHDEDLALSTLLEMKNQNADILRVLLSMHNGMVLAETINAELIEDLDVDER